MNFKEFYESRIESLKDRIEAYQWQVDEADKVIKKNQEWKDHSLEEIDKAEKSLELHEGYLRDLEKNRELEKQKLKEVRDE